MLSDVIALFSLGFVLYAYLGYPFMLWIVTSLKRPIEPTPGEFPTVSVIISAYNEEEFIAACLTSVLKSDYPCEKLLEIIVASESTDQTNTIVESFQHPKIRLLSDTVRRGKKIALDRAVEAARGEIVVFMDANGQCLEGTLTRLVSNFSDPQLGSVCGTRKILPTPGSMAKGDGLYWRYESKLRELESRTGCCYSGCDGILYAARRSLFQQNFPSTLNEDVAMCYSLFERGYLNRYDTQAAIYEVASRSAEDEFIRKTRIVARNIRTSWHFRHLYNPFRFPGFFYQNVSHRIIRWSVPFCLLSLFLVSALSRAGWINALFGAQLVCYGLAGVGYFLKARNIRHPLAWVCFVPLYFVVVNLAALSGWWKAIQLEGGSWQRVRRDLLQQP